MPCKIYTKNGLKNCSSFFERIDRSRARGFLWFDGLREFREHILVYQRIHVPAQHVDNPPVADVNVLAHGLRHFAGHHSIARLEETGPQLGHEHDHSAKRDNHFYSPLTIDKCKCPPLLTGRSGGRPVAGPG